MRSDRTVVESEDAPEAVGPYSQAVLAEGLLFCSGQIPLDPASGEIAGKTPSEQTTRCLENLAAGFAAAGAAPQRAPKRSTHTTEPAAVAATHQVYGHIFA